jgi:hypothetical protein
MPLTILFWVLMLFWLFFGFWLNHDPAQPFYRWGSGHLLLWILLAVLGWGVFGPPVSSATSSVPVYQQRIR